MGTKPEATAQPQVTPWVAEPCTLREGAALAGHSGKSLISLQLHLP